MLKARVVTALFLVAGFLAVLFLLPHAAATAAFALAAALGAWEWAGLMRVARRSRGMFAALVLFSCLVLWSRAEEIFPVLWVLAALFWLIVAPAWLVQRWRPGALGYLVGWVLLVPTWAALSALHGRAPELLLAVMALVWVADIGAYFTGRALGRRKLAPAISPGKTWEGVAGAVAGVLAYGFAVAGNLAPLREVGPFALAGFLLLLTALSVVGDLFESLIKRQAGMKDSGKLLPGHGGILDRIDSQTSTLPVAALGLYWMAS
jgi:phosphatidate cytidylyltransferase